MHSTLSGVRPRKDPRPAFMAGPRKRPRFSDVGLAAGMPTAKSLARIEDSGGDIALKSNATLTMRFILKARRVPRQYTQGTYLFYDEQKEDYLSYHEVQSELSLLQIPGVMLAGNAAILVLSAFRKRFRFLGVFRNLMPGNDGNLTSRQPLIGVDCVGRTKCCDLFKRAQTGDTLHFALVWKHEGLARDARIQGNEARDFRLMLVPVLNWGRKVSKSVENAGVLGDSYEDALGQCKHIRVLGLIHIGSTVRYPPHKTLRNRENAWKEGMEKPAQAMNLVEIILA